MKGGREAKKRDGSGKRVIFPCFAFIQLGRFRKFIFHLSMFPRCSIEVPSKPSMLPRRSLASPSRLPRRPRRSLDAPSTLPRVSLDALDAPSTLPRFPNLSLDALDVPSAFPRCPLCTSLSVVGEFVFFGLQIWLGSLKC